MFDETFSVKQQGRHFDLADLLIEGSWLWCWDIDRFYHTGRVANNKHGAVERGSRGGIRNPLLFIILTASGIG